VVNCYALQLDGSPRRRANPHRFNNKAHNAPAYKFNALATSLDSATQMSSQVSITWLMGIHWHFGACAETAVLKREQLFDDQTTSLVFSLCG